MRKIGIFGASVAAWLTPSLALAHSGHGEASGLIHGLVHPVGGLDHILALVLVGVLAWQLGGRAVFAVPASFVLLMAAGAAFGFAGLGLPFAEAGIALSVVALGLAVAFRIRAPVAAASALVGLFAVFHGHAHGAEMPAGTGGFGYVLGFLLATALLHIAGIAFAGALSRFAAASGLPVRLAGGAAAVMGMAILVGLA